MSTYSLFIHPKCTHAVYSSGKDRSLSETHRENYWCVINLGILSQGEVVCHGPHSVRDFSRNIDCEFASLLSLHIFLSSEMNTTPELHGHWGFVLRSLSKMLQQSRKFTFYNYTKLHRAAFARHSLMCVRLNCRCTGIKMSIKLMQTGLSTTIHASFVHKLVKESI